MTKKNGSQGNTSVEENKRPVTEHEKTQEQKMKDNYEDKKDEK